MKWKEIYKENKKRKYSEVTGIKKEGIGIECNSLNYIKQKKYYIIIFNLILILISAIFFYKDIKIMLLIIAFFLITEISFFALNYYKLECTKDGLYVKFGLQHGVFNYTRIKSVYLSKTNDSSYLLPVKSYNIVIRYVDNFNRLKELFFDTKFLNKETVTEFIDNFNIKDTEESTLIKFERFKLIRKILKIMLFILFVFFIIGYVLLKSGIQL